MTENSAVPSLRQFLEYEDETFTVERADENIDARLTDIDASRTDRHDDWERFTLRFDPEGETHLESDVYRLTHPGLDAFDVNITPVSTADPDPESVAYEAVFNRHVPENDTTSSLLGSDGPSRRGILAALGGLLAGGSLLGGLFGGDGAVGTAEAAGAAANAGALAGGDPYIGSIEMFPYTFAPRNWANCAGQEIAISQNNALYSLLGTQYGGDGRTTFRLPDLRGRVPVGEGQGPGLTLRQVGQTGGSESETLSTQQMPSHSHSGNFELPVSSGQGNAVDPDGNALAAQPDARGTVPTYTDAANPSGSMDVSGSIQQTGGAQSHNNMQPFTTVRFCIALSGLYPSRQ